MSTLIFELLHSHTPFHVHESQLQHPHSLLHLVPIYGVKILYRVESNGILDAICLNEAALIHMHFGTGFFKINQPSYTSQPGKV